MSDVAGFGFAAGLAFAAGFAAGLAFAGFGFGDIAFVDGFAFVDFAFVDGFALAGLASRFAFLPFVFAIATDATSVVPGRRDEASTRIGPVGLSAASSWVRCGLSDNAGAPNGDSR